MTQGQQGGDRRVRRITIVGGGTAGWMTAAMLSQLLKGFDIRLIESDQIGTIGVGEATIPAIRNYAAIAGIDQAEMLRASQATFKLGIEFVDWKAKGNSYIHGFGKIGQDLMWLHPHHIWLKLAAEGRAKHFDHYALNTLAARRNRFAFPDPRNPGSPMAGIDYAYHFDASLFAKFLRAQSEARGVTRIEGRIVEVARHGEDGHVTHVVLDDGRQIEGDLFIDCSGMRGLLIGEAMGVGYESWSEWLLCDRAQAVPCESVSPLTPYTRSTARDAGWQWRIPLQHRIGNGHVYASALTRDEAAAEVLLANLDSKPLADPRPVAFAPGKRHRAWEKNVVAIGLSGGFLEPLESTSIHLIQTGILRLIALFPASGIEAVDVAEYNRQTDFEYRDVRDFIIAHYKVTDREDTPFWRHVKHMAVPDSLAERLELFRTSGRFFMHRQAELFREESWVQVLIGQGHPMRYDPVIDTLPPQQISDFLKDIEEVIDDTANRMPDHAAFVARNFAAPAPPPAVAA
ncbi:Tryptophan 7-halogenase [Sphingomonas sp. EC-HK361]|uniref:tryptophan halogenase family protein n=1 Tax=Sphingomonas sp. EC-HK361 TaxID=2038397 RepID=UPI0012596635|nr:tryptophan halogenase family protein [Sphingomonas sp. EC-HK361]VVT21417.1 Tryptophan 7-halogenase [Sphingomonas sp. EC-HK361]